jgi:hypothetical protein
LELSKAFACVLACPHLKPEQEHKHMLTHKGASALLSKWPAILLQFFITDFSVGSLRIWEDGLLAICLKNLNYELIILLSA